MRLFHDPQEQVHARPLEILDGGLVPYREHSGRIDRVLTSIGESAQPADFGLSPIAAVDALRRSGRCQSAHETFSGHAICSFDPATADCAKIATDIAGCGDPAVILLEGGDALGANVSSVLHGFEQRGGLSGASG